MSHAIVLGRERLETSKLGGKGSEGKRRVNTTHVLITRPRNNFPSFAALVSSLLDRLNNINLKAKWISI